MEDRCVAQHCALDGGRAHFAALFDGHNGAHAATESVGQMCDVIARKMADAIAARQSASASAGAGVGGATADLASDLPSILYESFEAMNKLVRSKAEALQAEAEAEQTLFETFAQPSVGGTTAIVCVLQGSRAHIAGVGDSRCVLARGGRALRVTTDHKPRLPAEEERIIEAGGFVNRGRVHGILSVSRALGDFEFAPYVLAEPHVITFALCPEDRVLVLASDGLWDVISDQEAVDMALRVGTGPEGDEVAAGQFLVDEALRRGSRDNVSVLCIFRGEAGLVSGDRLSERPVSG
jgi:serine/threonine protein phosphatase PrpC